MSARLRTLVVDDEPLARARLCRLLERAPDIDVVAQCGDGHAAITTIRAERPDVLFLDVQMPEIDGFAVLAALGPEVVPALIFVTAFDRYAVRAFDATAVDYLLKPFDAARLDRAVDRARRQVATRTLAPLAPRLEALLAAVQAPRPPERLALPVGERTEFVDLTEVECVEAEGNYVAVRAGGRSYLVRDTLGAMEARLSPRQFVRIHRSRIVRIDRVRAVEPLFHGEYRLTLDSGLTLTSARSYRDALRVALGLAAEPAGP
ncbi:MAG: LytTR family DNA-binding domain-containing protein [Minicystis sp.]